MAGGPQHGVGLPEAFTHVGTASFADYLGVAAPDLLPGRRTLPPGSAADLAPHGTTIVACTFAEGVLLAGDRRATMGNMIAQRDIRKIYAADSHSAIGIAGTAGIAEEIVRLFCVELEHYEKIEGHTLSLDGKANRLAGMIRGNLGAAMQGLAVVPLFAGYDQDRPDPATAGRIFSYDVAGGRYEERSFYSIGSGSVFARGSLKKRWRAGSTEDDAVRVVIDALYDAADDDSATGGPDLTRRIFPLVSVVTEAGYRLLTQSEVERVVEAVVADRMTRPDG